MVRVMSLQTISWGHPRTESWGHPRTDRQTPAGSWKLNIPYYEGPRSGSLTLWCIFYVDEIWSGGFSNFPIDPANLPRVGAVKSYQCHWWDSNLQPPSPLCYATDPTQHNDIKGRCWVSGSWIFCQTKPRLLAAHPSREVVLLLNQPLHVTYGIGEKVNK